MSNLEKDMLRLLRKYEAFHQPIFSKLNLLPNIGARAGDYGDLCLADCSNWSRKTVSY